eukprot:TRINITY_DN15795_c0_g1_i2.p3 TRINITY_DN15795_c0_g1~~TRINITY_DN15795_c0_g1_i2.p3  ORF type:complete len:101 (+),score=12.83 TRINITY_DN15795_c0_g1_i2:118-420(+)
MCIRDSKKYPFFGFQFHPEKSQFCWLDDVKASHTPQAIEFGQYLTNTFINQARKNKHYFRSQDKLNDYAIEMYESVKVPEIYSSAFFFDRDFYKTNPIKK